MTTTPIPDALKSVIADRYELQRVIGSGGMATVYLARDRKHERDVAVKVLRPELAATLGSDRFLREIQIAAKLQHPHILMLIDSGESGGFLFYVMPFVDGESLRGTLVRERTVNMAGAMAITTRVADALTYAHRQGVVHRDIKPENILLSQGHAVVADFGIAKAVSTAGIGGITRTGFPLGTPGYMSPEQAAGRTELDETTDVYSLACVFYELILGDVPGMWVTDESVKMGRFMDATDEQRRGLDTISGTIEQALVRALALRPEFRFRTPNEFAQALEDAAQGKRYDEDAVREIVGRAATRQAEQPTVDGALTMGSIQRIGAEVGIPPEHVRDAARDIDRRDLAPARGGLFGINTKIDLEETLPYEVAEEDYPEVLEEIRAVMGEVGRLNPTLAKSFSWNSLSFQNSFEGSGRLVHVMVNPKGGKTRIRITEGSGVQAPIVAILGSAAAAIIGGAAAAVGPEMAAVAVAGSGGVLFFGARAYLRLFVRRRRRILGDLLDRIAGRHQLPPPSD